MKRSVYAVNAGSYSDYRIVAVFSTKAKAEAFMRVVSGDYNGLEEFALDRNDCDLVARGYSLWLVCMLRDGRVERLERRGNTSYETGEVGEDRIWSRSNAPAYKGTNTPDCLISTVWAKTEKQAVKIVNETRSRMVAEGTWPRPEHEARDGGL